MKKLVFVCVLFGLTILWNMGFSQGLQLTPMLSGEYIVHDSRFHSYKAFTVPDWSQSERPDYIYSTTPDLVTDNVFPHKNWVAIESDSGRSFEVLLTKDSIGNVWIAIREPYKDEIIPYYLVKGKDIKSSSDLIGVYWVSWYLVPGTKDVYPQLNYVSAE